MYLTKEEEQILNGEAGETLRQAIEILVALGDIYGADRLDPHQKRPDSRRFL